METHISNLTKCKDCNKDIIYYDTVIKDGIVKRGKSALSKKGNFNLVVCEACLEKKFPLYKSKNKSRVFNRMCEETQYAFNIPQEIYDIERRKLIVRSLDNFIAKYGKEVGEIKWEEYKKKQSITNTFEYKKAVHGMSESDFKEYNKSRAITLSNMIEKYGDYDGRKKYDEYCSKQQKTKSWPYMVEKYGEKKAREINKSKSHSLISFQLKYGEELGLQKFEEFIKRKATYCSKISQKFFDSLDEFLGKKFTTYYNKKNCEYGVNLKGSYVKLDYYILELNLCIEFNGTYYHADPRVYSETAVPIGGSNLTALEMWNRDNDRYKKLKELRDIDTIVMWQLDYNSKTFNPSEYINNVLNIKI
jgi:hypothetical protein